MNVPTVGEVDAIAAMDDPIVRNLRITQCYHELSRCVAVRVAPGANWCTFATWASRQAGQTIRGEDLERAASDVVGSPEIAELALRAARVAADDLGRGSPDLIVASVRRATTSYTFGDDDDDDVPAPNPFAAIRQIPCR